MFEAVSGALLIMFLRMLDVSLGTFRTILVVQAKKFYAGGVGFVEVLIWIFAMRYVFNHLDNTYNLIGYALGFGIGNIIGITLEEKVALGYVQVNIISRNLAYEIASALREAKFGVTLLPAEGNSGVVSLLVVILKRRNLKKAKNIIEEIDPNSFITVQHSRPYRGYIHSGRK